MSEREADRLICCPECRSVFEAEDHTPAPVPLPAEGDTEGLARLARYEDEWLTHPADAERTEGLGHHMSQMLYRLPRDGQTDDMRASIESMLADLRTALTDLAARDAATRADAREPIAALLDALDRTESRFRRAVQGKPVRDMAETLAENAEARKAALTEAAR